VWRDTLVVPVEVRRGHAPGQRTLEATNEVLSRPVAASEPSIRHGVACAAKLRSHTVATGGDGITESSVPCARNTRDFPTRLRGSDAPGESAINHVEHVSVREAEPEGPAPEENPPTAVQLGA
jgi:hypothetical protein